MNYNATTIQDVKEQYLNTRYKELASIGITVLEELYYEDKAIITNYSNGYSSIYILKQHRGQQLFIKLLQIFMIKIITMNTCNITDYLNKIRCNHIVVEPSKAYILIRDYYANKTTKRTNIPLMNHIDEGIKILNNIGVDQNTIDAYCLHPILQSDEDFNNNLSMDFTGINSKALLLAVEYRRVANSYLSTGNISDFVGFTNNNIKQMLFADKTQNEKDFRLYHESTHPKAKTLRIYFNNWLNKLLK